MISSLGYRDHTSKLFRKHNLLKLVDINKFQIANFAFYYHTHAFPNRPIFRR